jgi:predicted phage terminase large subunit-like protein
LSRDDFLQYRRLINPRLKINWFVEELAQELQQFYDDLVAGLKPMLIIEAPPQHGKSEAITDFISWVAGKHPNFKTIFASFSERLGIRANLKLQRIYSRKVYSDIFPRTTINSKHVTTTTSHQRNREMLEYVDQEGYFRNTTVQGSITGESLDLGVIDDPIKGREAANSETTRNKTWEWFTDDFFTRFSEDAGFLMILTRWHVDDPAARLIAEDKSVKVLKYKAIAEVDEEHRLAGEPLIPEHKSIEFLNKRKLIMGANFEALYQQNPTIKGGNLFQTKWLKPIKREVIQTMLFSKRFITADTALKDKEKNDYTVYSSWGVFENKLYLIDMFRGKPRSVERETIANAFHDKHNKFPFNGFYIEQKASGVDLYQRMSDSGKMVKEVERNTDKYFRAQSVEPYIEIHGLFYIDDIECIGDFINEYQQFPNAEHDDTVDTMMDAFELAYHDEIIDYNSML